MQQYQQTQLTHQLECCLAPFADNPKKLNQLIENISEFHFGGKGITQLIITDVISRLPLPASPYILDIGCALAGVSRYLVRQLNGKALAIDYSKSYLDAARYLNQLLKYEHTLSLIQADVNQLPIASQQIDLACMFHVGMNIRNKQRLLEQINAAVKNDGYLIIYDQCRLSSKPPYLPVPWADNPSQDFSNSVEEYQQTLVDAGFQILTCENYLAPAIQAFKQQNQHALNQQKIPLSVLLNQNAEQKLANMKKNIAEQRIAPFLLVAKKDS